MGITKGLQLQNNDNDETSEESDTNSHFAQRLLHKVIQLTLCAGWGREKPRFYSELYSVYTVNTALHRTMQIQAAKLAEAVY